MGKWKITGISLAVLIIAGVIFVNSPWLIAAAFYFKLCLLILLCTISDQSF